MTETPAPAKPRRTIRKGTPPKPDETLGALPAAAKKAAPKPRGTSMAKEPAKNAAITGAVADKIAVAPAPKPAKPAKAASERTKPLNFRVTNEFRKAFKQAAAAEDCKKVELLERIFAEWQKTQA